MGKKGKGKKQRHQDEQQHGEETVQPKQQESQPNKQADKTEKQNKQKTITVLQAKKIQYCPICTFPFELCKYGKRAADCKQFLMEVAPTKVSKYHPDAVGNEQKGEEQKKEKPPKQQGEPEESKETKDVKQSKETKQSHKKEKSVKDKFILIDVKQRDRKKFVSEVSGLSIFEIQSKQLAKKLSKKFACSCSATDDDKIVVQGDFFQDIKEILVTDYKAKKKYILDKDQYKEKVAEEKQKKKEKREKDKDAIPEQPEHKQQEVVEDTGPKFKNSLQAALADLEEQEEAQNK